MFSTRLAKVLRGRPFTESDSRWQCGSSRVPREARRWSADSPEYFKTDRLFHTRCRLGCKRLLKAVWRGQQAR